MGLLGQGPDMVAEIGLDARGFILGTRQVETSLNYLSRHPIFTSAAVAGVIGAAGLTAAMTFEDAMLSVAKTMDLTDEEMKAVGDDIRELSKVKPFTPQDIANVAAFGGQLGITKENLMSFTGLMLDMGAATNMTASQAADQFARFAASIGAPQDQFDEMTNTVVHLGNNLATTEAEIVKMAFRIGGAGKVVGLQTNEMFGLAAALSAVGVRAEQGGSGVSRIMREMHNAVNGSTDESRKSLETMSEIAGVTAEEFARVWGTNPSQAIVRFLGGLTEMEAAGQNILPLLNDMNMEGIRVSDVLLRAKNGQETVNKALGLAAVGWEENIAATKEAERKYSSTSNQLRLLGNDIIDVAIGIGEDMLPAVKDIIKELREFIQTGGGEMKPVFDAFGRLKDTVVSSIARVIEAFKEGFGADEDGSIPSLIPPAVAAIDTLTAAWEFLTEPLVIVSENVGKIARFLVDTPGAIEIFGVALAGLTVLVWGHAAGLTAMTAGELAAAAGFGVLTGAQAIYNGVAAITLALVSPFALIVYGIVAAVAAAILIYQNWDTVTAALGATWEWFTGVVREAWAWVVEIGEGIGEWFVGALTSLITKTVEATGAVLDAWTAIKEATAEALGNVWDWITGTWDNVEERFLGLKDTVTGLWNGFMGDLKDGISGLFTHVKEVLGDFVGALVGVFTGDLDAIRDTWNAFAEAVIGIGASIWDRVREPFENIVSTIRDFGSQAFDSMREGFEAGWEAVTEWFSGLADRVGEFFGTLPGTMRSIGRSVLLKLKEGGEGVWGSVSSWVSDTAGAVSGYFGGLAGTLYDVGYDMIRRLVYGVRDRWDHAKTWMEGRVDTLVEWWEEIGDRVVAVGSALIEGIKKGIADNWQAFIDWLLEKLGEAVDAVKAFFGIESPSKVFMGLGEEMVNGLAKGVEGMSGVLDGALADTELTVNTRGSMRARGGVSIGTLVVHANGRREGDEAGRALERRLQRLGVSG